LFPEQLSANESVHLAAFIPLTPFACELVTSRIRISSNEKDYKTKTWICKGEGPKDKNYIAAAP